MANSMRVNAELDSESEDEDEESSPPSPPSVQERQCLCCLKVVTARRCAGCGVCPICSPECEQFYGVVQNGTAACCYHRTVDKLNKVSPLDHECLGDLVGGPMAIMGANLAGHGAATAIQGLVQFAIDYVHANEKIAPLTMHTYIAAVLAPIATSVWSRGLLRVGHIPTHAAGTPEANVVEAENDVSIRLLKFAGKLAVAQSRSPGSGMPSDIDAMQAFVLARVVRIPKSAKASFDYGLQFDLAVASRTLNMNGEDLTCDRIGGGIRAAVAVYKLKGGLHETSGFPIFSFPGPTAADHVLLDKAACNKLKPLLSAQKLRMALNVHS